VNNKQELLFDLSKLTTDELFKKFDSSSQGLNENESNFRLKKYGLNKISNKKKENGLSKLINSLKNPLIILLVVLIVVSYLIKEHETAFIIAIMVVISALPTDNVDKKDLTNPKPWNLKNIEKTMIFLGFCISVFDFILFGIMIFIFNAWNNQSLFQTGWFVNYITIQVATLYVIRTSQTSFINSFPGGKLMISHILVLLVAFMLPYFPISKDLNLTYLPSLYWVVLFAIVLGYLFVSHIIKNITETKVIKNAKY
jgi:magnesium-transporting ATPase (P-type)